MFYFDYILCRVIDVRFFFFFQATVWTTQKKSQGKGQSVRSFSVFGGRQIFLRAFGLCSLTRINLFLAAGRQGSSSHSEEETACKRPKWQDESGESSSVYLDYIEFSLINVAPIQNRLYTEVCDQLSLIILKYCNQLHMFQC